MAKRPKGALGRTAEDPSRKSRTEGAKASVEQMSDAQPSTDEKDVPGKRTIPLMAANQAAFSFGNTVAPPFFSYYLLRLGGTAFHLGVLQALQYFFNNILQLPSAYASDRMGKRIPFIVAGIGISALVFLLITKFQDLWLLIILISVQSAALSIYFPSWSALVGDELSCANRGKVLAEITEASIVAGLMGTVTAFLFLSMNASRGANSFVLPFIAGAVSFLLAIIFILAVKETPATKVTRVLKLKDVDPNFLYLTKIQWAYNFFMTISWPLYPLTIAKVLNATNTQIAVLTLITVLATAAFQPLAGRMLDRIGSVPLIKTTRYVFLLVPFVYAFASDILMIYVWAIFEGLMAAMVNVSFISYILDSSPPETRAEYFAYYNTGLGVVTFCGTLIGGTLVTVLMRSMPLWNALLIVYVLGGIGRLFTAVPFMYLKPPIKKPSPPGQMAHAKMEFIRMLRRKH